MQCHSWMHPRPCPRHLPCPGYGGPKIKAQLYSSCWLTHWEQGKLRLPQWHLSSKLKGILLLQ